MKGKVLVFVATCFSLGYGQKTNKSIPLSLEWKHGLFIQSEDKSIHLHIGGRLSTDWAFMKADKEVEEWAGDFKDGTEMKYARLFISGAVYRNLHFKVQYQFTESHGKSPVFKDLWVGYTGIPYLGNIKIGHFKEPFSLSVLSSGKYVPLLERGLPTAFAPKRNVGAMLYDCPEGLGKRLTWAAGFFKDTDAHAKGTSEGNGNVTARLTFLPFVEDKGKKLLHLGLGASYRDPDERVRIKSKPEVHLAHYLADTGVVDCEKAILVSAEAAVVLGPLCFQSEYFADFLKSHAADDPKFSGFYLLGSWFITGETRHYSRSKAAFSRTNPRANFIGEKTGQGPGAIELALRFSQINLTGGSVRGGKEWDISCGLNWYPFPMMRLGINYVHARIGEKGLLSSGSSDSLAMRLQFAF